MQEKIVIKGARLHNLQNITVSIPRNKFVVVTGLSGSGKSTLIFEILHTEGQRQYLESLGISRDTLQKPEVDTIEGLAPSIAVDQNYVNRSSRSTVGTVTEIFTYLRLLYARIGHRACPQCGKDIAPLYAVGEDSSVWDIPTDAPQPDAEALEEDSITCTACGKKVVQLSMAHFSFNTPMGACPTCTGLGKVHEVNIGQLLKVEKSILDGGVAIWGDFMANHHTNVLRSAAKHYGFDLDPSAPIKQLGEVQRDLLLYGTTSPQFKRHYPTTAPPKSVAKGNFEGVVNIVLRRFAEHSDGDNREDLEKLLVEAICPDCQGNRLCRESCQVTINGRTIIDVSRMPLHTLYKWYEALPDELNAQEVQLSTLILTELRTRVQRLLNVGIGYLALERTSPTLSTGEAQRLRLATLLGSGLTGVLYVLDEPTIGLHPRDNEALLKTLRQLRDMGNTVLVIEHDLDIVQAADHVIEIGPGAGQEGGQLVAEGNIEDIAASAQSVTGRYLSGAATIAIPRRRSLNPQKSLQILGAREHNLKNIDVSIPLGGFVAITGVSGSGKSSLLLDILHPAARQRLAESDAQPGAHDRIEGWEHLDKVITIDQIPVGRTPRSNTATYTDAFSLIRNVFAGTDDARRYKLKTNHFSFNVSGGRCEHCEGAGVLTVKMHFLPDAFVTCPVCHGKRFKNEVLAVKYRDQSIADALDMTIHEAYVLFQDIPAIEAKLSLLKDVGLGYLQLGQPATTLSGGEIQRIKLAKELSRRTSGHVLYLLDEPTIGLHTADVGRLLTVLHRLVDAGNSVVVIEHNLDVIKTADWIIDLGPEGGEAGGSITAIGTPEQVIQVQNSYTGRALYPILQQTLIHGPS